MKKLTSRMIRFTRDKLFEIANNSNPAFKPQGQKEFTYDNYNKLKTEASLFDVKEWVAVDDILKNIQDMKSLWQEDVLEEKWFDDLINTLTPTNKNEQK